MRKIFSVSAIIALSALLVACFSTYDEIEDSVWIDDSEISGLPAYTECGYNTFGARYFGSSFFFSRNKDKPGYFIWRNDSLTFTLNGFLEDHDVIVDQDEYAHSGYYRKMTLSIQFPCDTVKSFEELMCLDQKTIDLTDSVNKVYVYIMDFYNRTRIYPNSGTFDFKRVQRLFLDDKAEAMIVSGTFDVLSDVGGRILTLKDGRFDIGIKEECFLYIK